MSYDVYSKFDMIKHKQKFVHYLEVIIFPDGHVEYANPSHQEKLIAICCEELRVSRDTLCDMCPKEYYCDFIVWLCNQCGCISVWTDFYQKSDQQPLTAAQKQTLIELKENNIFEGDI